MTTIRGTILNEVSAESNKAMKLTPDLAVDPLLTASQFVGKPYPRVDGRLKVTGRARYSAEQPLAGMTYAVPVHSTIARGRITDPDTAAAEAVPGVLAVMTYHNAPRLKTPAYAYVVDMAHPLVASATTLPVMQDPAIHWNGQVVALVVAETNEAATYAASLVRVTYAAQTPRLVLAAHKADAFAPDHVVRLPAQITKGDAEANLARAPVRVDQTYTTPTANHQAMEPHATTAVWDSATHLTVYDSTQYPTGVKEALVEIFGLEKDGVRVVTDFVGGAFGGKGAMCHHVPLAAAAAQLVQRPVKLNLPRASVNRTVGGRTMTEQRVALGATPDGQLTAFIHSGYLYGPGGWGSRPSVGSRLKIVGFLRHSAQINS